MGAFSIATHHEGTNKITIQMNGVLTRDAASSLNGALERLPKSKHSQMIVNTSNLKHLNGEGLHLLAIFITRAISKGYHVTLRGMTALHRQLFHLTQLTEQKQSWSGPNEILQPEDRPELDRSAHESRFENEFNGHWMVSTNIARFSKAPLRAVNLNVHGRTLASPMKSFGRMWLRTYRTALGNCNLNPEEVMAAWKERFTSFWPPGNHLYSSTGAIEPGAVCLINLAMPLGLTLSTGAVVIYSNETSFTLMTVQGHMFSGFITFSTYRENGIIHVQTQALIRPNDLVFESSFWLGFGTKSEDDFWIRTMRNISTYFVQGNNLICPLAAQRKVEVTAELIDPKIKWQHFGNLWYNAGIRSFIYMLLTPLGKLLRKKQIQQDG